MRISRLYLDQNIETDTFLKLPPDKAHYVGHVLRLRKGDNLVIFNSTGYEFESKLVEISKKSVRLKVQSSYKVDKESFLKITLALGVSRAQHMDYALQKAVELGVSQIVPLITEYSNVRFQGDRVKNKLIHWNNIIISATEQCGRTKLPELFPPLLFKDWLNSELDTTCLILHPAAESSLESISVIDNDLALLIGPEGGFSESEVQLAIQKDFVPVKLGPRILRTETTVVTILSIAQQLWGDFS